MMNLQSSPSTQNSAVCYFFQSGRCKYGDKCKNNHVAAQTHGLRDTSKATLQSASSHMKEKSPCMYWMRGGCARGNMCTFGHDPKLRASEKVEKAANSLRSATGSIVSNQHASDAKVTCSYWARGICTRGERCSYWHDPEAMVSIKEAKSSSQNSKVTMPCSYWKQGACVFGDSYSYRHDPVPNTTTQEVHESTLPDASSIFLADKPPCVFWTQGICTRGDTCKFWHDPAMNIVDRNEVDNQTQSSSTTKPITCSVTSPNNEKMPCSYWSRGTCARGDACRYWHDPDVKDALRREEEARREEKVRLDSTRTIQHIVSGSTLVRFGPGVNIERVVTGFESCRLGITNLSLDIRHPEVLDLLRDHCGLDPNSMVHLVSLDLKPSDGCKDAALIVEENAATVRRIEMGLDGLEFRGQTLRVETTFNGSSVGMNNNSKSGNWLVISWRIPSMCFVVRYSSGTLAEQRMRSMNGTTVGGRKITVVPNRTRLGTVDPKGVFVSGIPLNVSRKEVRNLFKSEVVTQIPTEDYDDYLVDSWVVGYVRETVGAGSVEFDETRVDKLHGTRSVRVRFQSWEDAKDVHDHLKGMKFERIGNSAFGLWLSDPYQITIPIQQYQAQKKIWDALAEGKHLHVGIQGSKVIIRIGGRDLKAVGTLKVRVESLGAGEILNGMWHRWFAAPDGKKFLDSVYDSTGAFVTNDWKLKALRVYGESHTISRAREIIAKELEQLTRALEYTRTLKRQSIRFFLHRGVAILKEAFGEDSVTLDVFETPCRITVRGGEAALHLLDKLIVDSLQNITTDFSTTTESICPICTCEVSNPFQLGCGHEYCTNCLRHFFTTDVQRFPLVCPGDDSKCMQPIAIPMLQKFLTHSQFHALLEQAFASHVEKNPQMYKYCKTPDCQQIYPCSSSMQSLRCPSCLVTVCTKCHEEGHEGLSCEERKKYTDPAEQERLTDQWAKEAGAKRCPQCKVWIQKSEGCNHMACKCGAHICWVCMGVFASESIYSHMNQAHGSIYDVRDPVIRGEDIQAQLQALRLYDL